MSNLLKNKKELLLLVQSAESLDLLKEFFKMLSLDELNAFKTQFHKPVIFLDDCNDEFAKVNQIIDELLNV